MLSEVGNVSSQAFMITGSASIDTISGRVEALVILIAVMVFVVLFYLFKKKSNN